MVYWYSKGQSQYTEGNFHMAYYIDMDGYDEVNYDSQDIEGDGASGDPFMAFGIDTQTWAYGQGQVEIGLLASYRIRINSSGIYGWDGDSWENLLAAGGASNLSELNDVVITTPADNEVLAWDTTSSKWINQTAGEAGLALVSQLHAEDHNNTHHTTNYHTETDGTGVVTVHSDITSAGSGIIITTEERNALHTATLAFKTITGITNNVVADSATDTLTLAAAGELTIVGTTATDTITFTNTHSDVIVSVANVEDVITAELVDGQSIDNTIDTLITNHNDNTTTAHGAVSAATVSKIVVRDASGRAKFVAGAAAGDAAIYEQLHPQAHTLASHSTKAHSELSDAPANAHHVAFVQGDADALILTHKNITDAHHSVYLDADAVQAVEDAGLDLSAAKVITSVDSDLIFTFGRAALASPVADTLYLAHRDRMTVFDYALKQSQVGSTSINAVTAGEIYFNINDTEIGSISATGFQLGNANARVTTILDEDAMGSNSDTALATQQSIKKYVDDSIPSVYTDADAVQAVEDAGLVLSATKVITTGDEDLGFTFGRAAIYSIVADTLYLSHRDRINVTDYALKQDATGNTSINAVTAGEIQFLINNVEKGSFSNSGFQLGNANARITEFDSGALANIDTVVPTSKAVTTAITTHKNITDAHHIKYTNAEVQALSINNVVEDAFPQLGGDLDLNGKTINCDGNLGSDHTFEGLVLDNITNTQAFGKLVYIISAHTTALCDKDSIKLAIGISVGTGEVLYSGTIRDDSFSGLAAGNPVYVGDDGNPTDDISGYTAGDMVQCVGIALDTNVILIKDICWVEVV